ncbi:hypothetical protein Taro_023477 [Colocasia esculenta]|uniref:Ubiquitin-like protease family profile domain-containing protein n=1 Tax=Colocasia esculenta TaxID=4460 RepID=A0A843VBJ8_COLES|nr:hypothetical protein [Colocasia esculenta]
MNKIVFPCILRWEGPKKRKVQVRAKNLKTEQILLSLIPHSEEEWLLSGLESSTKVVERGEQEEEEERQENKKEKDREESEETGEMSPSKWSTVMSEMRNELTGVVCRIEERDRQTRRELEEFGTKLDSLFKQLKSYMTERKSSTTGPENDAKDMTNMGQTEEVRGSSTSPAPMDVDELDKVVEMAGNVGTLNREEDKEEYEVIVYNEEEDPEATISIKYGQAIDIGFQFLIEKMENSPDQYHICTYTPTLLVHNFQSKKAKIMERVKLMKISLPNMASKGDIDKVDLLFFVLFTSNHWRLLVVDVKKKRATSYNSIKGSTRYMAAAKRWVTLLDAFFKF